MSIPIDFNFHLFQYKMNQNCCSKINETAFCVVFLAIIAQFIANQRANPDLYES